MVVILGIVGVSAVPVLSQSAEATRAASKDEVVRFFEYARSRAMSAGKPVGVRIDTAESLLGVVSIDESGSIETISDLISSGAMQVNLPSEYAGASVQSFTNGNAQQGNGIVWFDYQGVPHIRDDSSGAFVSMSNQNAALLLSSGVSVEVHAHTGFVREVR
ncbi:MAG: Tfp pilus assembly protein FimT/FimU [Phycisphaerales bacterium]